MKTLKAIIRFAALVIMLFNALGFDALAQSSAAAFPERPNALDAVPFIEPASNPLPLGSAPNENNIVATPPQTTELSYLQNPALQSPISEAEIEEDKIEDDSGPQTAQEYFNLNNRRADFKLFEPSRYELLQDDAPIMLPPAQDEEEESMDNYYRYGRAYLENVIKNMEGAVELREKAIEYLEILNPSILVPIYGTTISLTGRKTFGLNYSAKKYKGKKTVDDRSFSTFNFTQEMQIKLQGKISDRIFVDIDYDDQKEDAQNISVAYRGKGEEFVQSADFGDIELSLPNTEFLSYNKQVFGAKMHLKYGGANLRLIGSQTKGSSKSKQFKGNSVFETVNIRDTQYIRRKYYSLNFEPQYHEALLSPTPGLNGNIVPGTETIFLDDHTNNGYPVAMQAQDYATGAIYPATGGNAPFRVLTRGVDYVIDYNRNIIIFNSPLNDTDVVAASFQTTDPLYPTIATKIIKTSGDRPLQDSNEAGYRLEIKRYYNIGAKQITRDNGQGNFTLKLLESGGSEVCPATSAPDYCTNIVDYEKGIFEIYGNFIDDPSVYNTTPSSGKNRYFFVQFSSTVRTYFLEPDIVVQSETVKINGATMARNKDYYVDYASGFITFYKSELIGANSTIDVTYETSSGGNSESALLGGRFNYDFTQNISIGASLLNEGGSEPSRVPNVNSLTNNLTVMEADLKAKDVKVMDGVKVSLGVEAAQSKKDENLFGSAMIDNLEETKEYVKASTTYNDWKISSNPSGQTSFFDAIKWDSQDIKTLDINPSSAARADSKQTVLTINYDFSLGDEEVSIVFPISAQGTDFTQKTLLELLIAGDNDIDGPLLNISFGSVDERSDNYNSSYGPIPPGFNPADIFPTCSKYYAPPPSYYVPKTEDLRCTGQLTPAEDIGWLFVNPDGTYRRYNPFANNQFNKEPQPNGRVDTQDLDGNGILDTTEDVRNYGFAGVTLNIGPNPNKIDFKSWKQFQLEDFRKNYSSDWSSIKQMRVTLKKGAMTKEKGTIKIANLAVSGSTWQSADSAVGNALIPYGINNIDNPNTYKPIFNDSGDGGEVFRALYGSIDDIRSNSSGVKEQSLALAYDFSLPPDTDLKDLSVQHNFNKMDFSQHKQFRFLLYNYKADLLDPDATFYLQIAADDTRFAKIEIPLDFPAEWRLYSFKLIDTNGDGIPEKIENNSKYASTIAYGADNYVNFNRISTIKAGIIDNTSSKSGEVWLDEIYLTDSVVTTGSAYMAEGKIDIENWLEAGGKFTYMDDKFQTPLAVPTKQKNTREDYFLNFKRVKNLPVNAEYSRSNTVTPDVLDYTSSNTVSVLDAGEVSRDRGSIKAQYQNPDLPRIGLQYAFNNSDYEKLQRSDSGQYYAANIDYSPKTKEPLLKNISAGAALSKNKINYSDSAILGAPSSYYDTNETTQSYDFKLYFQPWKGSSIVPNYSLSTVDETRHFYNGGIFANKHYDKSASQNAGVSAALRIGNWITPTASYSVNIRENNNLSAFSYNAGGTSYPFEIGAVKSINRTSDGNIGLTLNGKEILPSSKLFAGFSVSGAYKLQDGDAWENVDESFNSLDKIWLRGSLGLNSPYTYRSKLTLRDTYSSTLRWTPFNAYGFDGKLSPFKTLSIMNNFAKSYQTTEDLGSAYKTQSVTLPDLVIFIDNIEKFFGNAVFFNGANLKLKYNYTQSETTDVEFKEEKSLGADLRFVLFNYFDNTFSYTQKTLDKTNETAIEKNKPLEDYLRRDFSAQSSFNYGKIRFTPKFTYLFDTRTQGGDILVSEVKEIVPSLNIRADFNLPYGLQLPFISRRYLITNRIIWNTNFSYSRRRSFTVTENRDLFDINTSFDYEISKNIRLTLNGAFQSFKHLYIEEESYTAYSVGTVMTVQF
ncbi:MAG: hypothetical protein LBG46_06940 [Elusimicrobiota bacterium]|jgi:hypothetical protein|nr:hypothetical protein [Elusimicrobiota bacterium]